MKNLVNMKTQIKQIKIFKVDDYDNSEKLETAVNNFVSEIVSQEGNYPTIETNSKFISVIGNRLVEVKDKKNT